MGGKKRPTDLIAKELEQALDQENDDSFAALLDRIEDVNAPFKWLGFSVTPMEYMLSAEGRSIARLDLLFERGARADDPARNPLWRIPDYSFKEDGRDVAEIVRRLVVAGADIEGGPQPWSPLAAAVFAGAPEEARAFLAAGADPNLVTERGNPNRPERKSLLRMAAIFPDVLEALLEYGATVQGSGALEHVNTQLAGDTGRAKDRCYFDSLRESKRLLDGALRR